MGKNPYRYPSPPSLSTPFLHYRIFYSYLLPTSRGKRLGAINTTTFKFNSTRICSALPSKMRKTLSINTLCLGRIFRSSIHAKHWTMVPYIPGFGGFAVSLSHSFVFCPSLQSLQLKRISFHPIIPDGVEASNKRYTLKA